MIKIGTYKLPSNILLAPLAGCADLSFRLIAREHGAKFCYFEMVDANALQRNKRTLDFLKTTDKDRPIAAQLVGADPEMMLNSAKKLLDLVDISFLDVNAACPVKKILKKRSGAYLMKEPEILYKILDKLSSSLKIPITVKLRTGFNKVDMKELYEIARNCEKSGASAIFIHGRTRKQIYSGPVNYEAIKAVKEAVNIPVFGSGNIMTPELAKKMLDDTRCDGILVARGAFGNPWIFNNIESFMKGKPLHMPTTEERKMTALKHIGYIQKYSGALPKGKLGLMRKAAHWYMKGFMNAANMRSQANTARNMEELIGLILSAKDDQNPRALT